MSHYSGAWPNISFPAGPEYIATYFPHLWKQAAIYRVYFFPLRASVYCRAQEYIPQFHSRHRTRMDTGRGNIELAAAIANTGTRMNGDNDEWRLPMNDNRPKQIRLMSIARSRLLRTAMATRTMHENAVSGAVPVNLRGNASHAPLRVDAWNLRLSWSAPAPEAGGAQAHYQVQVATRVDAFADTGPLAWDSGKACGAQPSVRVPPFALLDATVYFWRVRTWDGAGKVSPWSAAQCIVTSGGPAFTVAAQAGCALTPAARIS